MSRSSEIDYDWRKVMADRDKTSSRDVRDADESEDFSSGQQTVIPPSTGPRSRPGEKPTTQEGEEGGEGQAPGVPVGPGKGP